jgi:predicted dehydrogenase/threonine dehydrogenase-like Zn-dependent dehydrogenase
MKQLLHSFKNGHLQFMDTPMPHFSNAQVRIQTKCSLISTGTERMLISFGKSGYLKKARQQPEKVRQVLDKVQTDGLFSTIDAVRSKLNQPIPMGYCNVGIVHATGQHVSGIQKGDRVLSNGPHAEMVCVGHRLCARIPDAVDDATASFAIPGAIALQGIRLLNPTLGESIVVIGLGLIGLLTVQLLRANGCRVMGLDMDLHRCKLAEKFGGEAFHIKEQSDPVSAAHYFSNNKGVDGVLITAATHSNDPINHSSQMCRKKGRIVLVGVSGLNINRNLFYEKELSFQVSCAYGPGRYDPLYEDNGQDYPLPHVRWTAQRNMEAVLDLMASGKINPSSMISYRFPFEKAQQAYDLILEASNTSIGIILDYHNNPEENKNIPTKIEIHSSRETSKATIGMIGAGNFSAQVLLPALQKTSARLKTIASKTGVSGTYLAKKFQFEKSTTDLDEIFSDPDITTIVITTRHDSHANLVLRALDCGKHVFVEKPLCLTQLELKEIQDKVRYVPHSPILMVGFNRRFSPFIQKIMHFRQSIASPLSMIMTVNAGEIPKDHWAQDLKIGGGRIVGEACHFIDLLRYIAQNPITDIHPIYMAGETNDTVSIQIRFKDGSIGTVHYYSNGHKRFPKERLEIFADGTIIQLDNFKRLNSYGVKMGSRLPHRQDKGHLKEIEAFISAIIEGAGAPIPLDEIFEVMDAVLKI